MIQCLQHIKNLFKVAFSWMMLNPPDIRNKVRCSSMCKMLYEAHHKMLYEANHKMFEKIK